MGGIGSLPMDYGQPLQVPQQQQPSFSSAQNITMNPLLNYGQPQLGQAGGTPLTMANGGSANLVEREQYGLGSKLKKFVRKIIPNEISSIAVKAAPFVAPFNPALAAAMAGIGGFDQTGRIGSSLLSAGLTYGAGQLARGIGGAGFQGNPFTGVDFSGGFTSGIGSLFSSPTGNLPFGTFSTPTQLDLTGAGTDYGINEGLRTTTTTGTGNVIQNVDVTGAGTDYGDTLGARTTSNVPFVSKEPGYVDLLKKAGSFENVPLSERFNAVKDLSAKALTDLYTKPIPGQPGKTQLDKTALFATLSGASSYYEALQMAKKAGVSEGEFSEADYQRLKVDPKKKKYQEVLKPESFGIRPTAAGGGLMNEGVLSIMLTPNEPRENFQVGGMKKDMSNNRYSQIIQLIRDAESIGDFERAEELRLDLFRETKKAKGGKINYPMGNEIPVRQNQGGVSELDLRAKGGYIPVGIKEKADDVPAMLSRNEFVFTADAVRGAGNGSINKGAQKMYKLMKSLEKKVKQMKKVA
jgi:hypothetical protein